MTKPTPAAAADPSAAIDALSASVGRLQHLATPLSLAELSSRAYPTEWTQAQVLSHLGSGAVITQRRLEDTLAEKATPDDFAPGVWDVWNAKDPVAQRDDALAADAAFLARIQAVTSEQREGFTYAMGSMTFDFAEFVGLRLNEHAFHTWDIEVVTDAAATIPAQVAAVVIDNLQLVARFTAKPTGDTTTITVATTDPSRGFTIELTPDTVTTTPGPTPVAADLRLPAEAFCRLVYGRLDDEHTPAAVDGSLLDVLRRVFPGP
jgi:uncharacterized protein (TIGR03083 family)